MRIWSIHPKYLDSKGLVGLWRETLLAKHVIEGKTIGYKNHPQLIRFKQTNSPVGYLNQYLIGVYFEAVERGYNFKKDKIDFNVDLEKLPVTNGQLTFEFNHLMKKLKIRDIKIYNKLNYETNINPHPLFEVIDGGMADWEKKALIEIWAIDE